MMSKEFICIVCPRGCHIKVDEINNISGNQCKRGEAYVKNEMQNPKRVLTTTVRTTFLNNPRVSVKTDDSIPKDLIFPAMELINKVIITKKMEIGEVVISNILNTGVNIVLTKGTSNNSNWFHMIKKINLLMYICFSEVYFYFINNLQKRC